MFQTAIFDPNTVVAAVNNVNWLQPSWDLFIILFFIVASLIYGVSLGRDRIIVILVSIYMALAIVGHVPFLNDVQTAEVSLNETFALRISVFLGLFVLLFFFLSHSALMKAFGHGGRQGKFWQVMIYSFLHVGLLISVTLSFFPSDLAMVLSPITQTLFMNDVACALWVTLPVVAMAVFGSADED